MTSFMTEQELDDSIGTKGLMHMKGQMYATVIVLRHRENNWGRVHFKVKPLKGTGDTWIDEASLIRERE